MIRLIIQLTILLITAVGFSQNFQGMAVYESKTSTSEASERMRDNKNITPEMLVMIEARMKKMSEKTFILNFDKNTSIYKEEEKLDAAGGMGMGGRMMASFSGGGGTHYKNIKEKQFIVDKEMFGKEFLVKDTIPTLKWKMGTETKQIGSYLCFKATAMKKTEKSDFRNARFKKEEPKKEGEADKDKAEKPKSTNFMDMSEMPKEIEITAWYTPDIPVSNGPENYFGLPGLILEVTAGKTVVLCSKIVMNVKEKTEIKAPTNGKEVTQTEFDKIITEKMEEFRQNGMRQGGGGNNMIRMGR